MCVFRDSYGDGVGEGDGWRCIGVRGPRFLLRSAVCGTGLSVLLFFAFLCVYMYIFHHTLKHPKLLVYIYIYIYVCVCVCVCVCMCVCVCASRACIHA